MHERRQSELVELELVHAESATERNGEDAHVDRVRERVLIVIADCGEADERSLFVQNLIDDPLYHALDLSDVRGLADANRIDDVLGDGDRLGVRTIGGRLGFLVELSVGRGLGRRVDLERLDLGVL